MKQKYLLIAAAVILFFLIIIVSVVNRLTQKPPVQIQTPRIQNKDNVQFKKDTTDSGPQYSPPQQKERAALQDFFAIFSGPTQQTSSGTPTAYINKENSMSSDNISYQNSKSGPRESLGEFLGIVFGQNVGSLQQSSFYPNTSSNGSKSPSSILQPQNLSSTINPLSSNLVYYSQCNGEYDNYPLPNGCTLCKAGCGQTTAAMILSSYIDKKFTPATVAELYKQQGFTAGCKGSTVGDAQRILEQNGMKTTDLLYYGDSSFEETADDLRSYLKAGWTMFMLAKFCPKGCGHFFWIVDVDDNDNVWTYDPGYGNIDGKKIVPLNETLLNPPAQYYVAFGVKKE